MGTTPTSDIGRALIVEDQPAIADIERLMLEADGYDVTVCSNVDDAVVVLAQWTPQVVILDIRLGSADGLNLLSYIRRRMGIHPPVLLVTGYADPQVISYATQLGNVGVLPKSRIGDLRTETAALRLHEVVAPLETELTGRVGQLAQP